MTPPKNASVIKRHPLAVTKVAGVRTPKPTGSAWQPKAPGLPVTGK